MKWCKLLFSLCVLGMWAFAMGQEAKPPPLLEATPAPNGTVAGRYILMQGPPLVDNGGMRLFRLDTMTGRCWFLQNTPVQPEPNGRAEVWMPTVELESAIKMGIRTTKK